jgi:hypothetical protein
MPALQRTLPTRLVRRNPATTRPSAGGYPPNPPGQSACRPAGRDSIRDIGSAQMSAGLAAHRCPLGADVDPRNLRVMVMSLGGNPKIRRDGLTPCCRSALGSLGGPVSGRRAEGQMALHPDRCSYIWQGVFGRK